MFKNRNILLPFFMAIMIVLTAASCASSGTTANTVEAEETAVNPVTLINPLGPVVIPVACIRSGALDCDPQIDIQLWKTADEAIGLLSSDEAQFAVLPVTTGVNLTASGLDLVLLGVHEWKVFYLVAAEGVEFTGWDSLVGKTVYTPGAKGQTVDVLTRFALANEGITPDEDVTFTYAPVAEIVTLFVEGKIDFAAIPEPFVTQALTKGDGEIVLDYQDYWSEVSGAENGIPIAGLFVKRDYLESNPETVEQVISALAASTQWGNENPDEAIQAVSDVLPMDAAILKAALERIQFNYVPAIDAQEDVLNFLTTMQETYPDGIKMIPEDKFFGPG